MFPEFEKKELNPEGHHYRLITFSPYDPYDHMTSTSCDMLSLPLVICYLPSIYKSPKHPSIQNLVAFYLVFSILFMPIILYWLSYSDIWRFLISISGRCSSSSSINLSNLLHLFLLTTLVSSFYEDFYSYSTLVFNHQSIQLTEYYIFGDVVSQYFSFFAF